MKCQHENSQTDREGESKEPTSAEIGVVARKEETWRSGPDISETMGRCERSSFFVV